MGVSVVVQGGRHSHALPWIRSYPRGLAPTHSYLRGEFPKGPYTADSGSKHHTRYSLWSQGPEIVYGHFGIGK